MLRVIFKSEEKSNTNIMSFYDDPIWGEDMEKDDPAIVGIVKIEDEIGCHACIKSAIWDDMSGYVDEVQKEEELPENERFVVTYFKHGKSFDLEQLVDYDITKQQIIENIKNQKYIEGADYFLLSQVKLVSTIRYDFLDEFKSLNEMGMEWFKQEIDSLIEDSKIDISNHQLWLKGSMNEEEELMEIENIKNNEDYRDFLIRLREALGE